MNQCSSNQCVTLKIFIEGNEHTWFRSSFNSVEFLETLRRKRIFEKLKFGPKT